MLTGWDKAIVSLIMAVVGILNLAFDFRFANITQDQVSAFILAIWPIVVWMVPNKPKQPTP